MPIPNSAAGPTASAPNRGARHSRDAARRRPSARRGRGRLQQRCRRPAGHAACDRRSRHHSRAATRAGRTPAAE